MRSVRVVCVQVSWRVLVRVPSNDTEVVVTYLFFDSNKFSLWVNCKVQHKLLTFSEKAELLINTMDRVSQTESIISPSREYFQLLSCVHA